MELPYIVFSHNEISDFDKSINKEWLITNGLGGYSSSTILGINTRKYHALLVAAFYPPRERRVTLSKLDEDLILDGKIFRLGANDFSHGLYPQGYSFLKEFKISPFPTYVYKKNKVVLKKTILLPYEKNAVVAFYDVTNKANSVCSVKIYPLIAYRNHHNVINRKVNPVWLNQKNKEKEFELAFNNPMATIIARAINGKFIKKPVWVEGLFYRKEEERGESSFDQGYQPGFFDFHVSKNSNLKFAVISSAATNKEKAKEFLQEVGSNITCVENLFNQEVNSRLNRLENFYYSKNMTMNDDLNWILLAANDFIAKGFDDRRFILAGFHWFGSWGRDTFVSLPGLMLITNRFTEARKVILEYANYCSQGIIPNLINDKTGELMFNTVDGTLWFINTILQYLKNTADFAFIKNHLWQTLKDIIENHKKGTIKGIYVDNDGLLSHGPQLTWMDAIVDGAPFTPRAGKAVEIQALWYNALCTLQLLARIFGEKRLSDEYFELSEKAKTSFNKKFWNSNQNCLFDVVEESGSDSSLRPNQLIAGALDFRIIDEEKAKQVVDLVQKELLTPVGLRSLSPKDPRYKSLYSGDRKHRDQAYHNGTVWPWLLGPFITIYLKTKGYTLSSRQYISEKIIKPFFTLQVRQGGLGTISEIYDADLPYTPRGCMAQAWSVAEPLRAYVEDVCLVRPRFESQILSKLNFPK